MRYAFIRDNRVTWPVEVMCGVLQVSRGGFYGWLGRPPSRRTLRGRDLAQKVRQLHEANRCVYGSPRVHAALVARGERVSRNTVAKVMARQNLRGRSKRRYVPRTTDSRHEAPVAPNRLGRDFAAPLPNRKWACDITYVPTDQGWLYVAAVMDLCSRRIIGWSMAGHMKAELCTDALSMALGRRCVKGELIHHSDRGVQYACEAYQELLVANGITCSMSNKGDCYDNAAMESFWATLKGELVNRERYATREQANLSIFEYIEVFYNRQRLHSSLGYLSPEAFEARLK